MSAARLFLVVTALALGGCSAEPVTGDDRAVALPADAVVLPGSVVGQILHQCSRSAPAPGEATWQPAANDIALLEAALPAALAASDLSRIEARLREDPHIGSPSPDDSAWTVAPQGWRRQYVGIVRGGRRFVYGNFFPFRPEEELRTDSWRAEPQLICDGGPVFFGAEWDVAARRFTQIDFNGAI